MRDEKNYKNGSMCSTSVPSNVRNMLGTGIYRLDINGFQIFYSIDKLTGENIYSIGIYKIYLSKKKVTITKRNQVLKVMLADITIREFGEIIQQLVLDTQRVQVK